MLPHKFGYLTNYFVDDALTHRSKHTYVHPITYKEKIKRGTYQRCAKSFLHQKIWDNKEFKYYIHEIKTYEVFPSQYKYISKDCDGELTEIVNDNNNNDSECFQFRSFIFGFSFAYCINYTLYFFLSI